MKLSSRGFSSKVEFSRSAQAIQRRTKHHRRYVRTMFAGLLGIGFTCASLPHAKGQSVQLSSLNGANGFSIPALADDNGVGISSSSAGDVNGDGFADLIVGAPFTNYSAGYAGSAYVVFGKSTQTSSSFDLSTIDGNNGFRIDGEVAGDFAGFAVSRAGDVNHDGFDDVLIGAPYANAHGSNAGRAYVVFGKAAQTSATFALSTIDGTNGFKINGAGPSDLAGLSVSPAGDVNNDGFDDVMLGAPHADFDVTNVGAGYVVFGGDDVTSIVELGTLEVDKGLVLQGSLKYDNTGASVAGAGDINNDGFDDVLVGVPVAHFAGPYAGATYVVFGQAHFSAASLELVRLNGTDGFRIDGSTRFDYVGKSVSGAGDVNGDGFADIILGAPYASTLNHYAGAGFVVFGKSSFTSNVLELKSLDGSNGFRLEGERMYDYAGRTVSGAGDVNNDGFDDLILGAYNAPGKSGVGASYVVFGKPSFTTSSLSLSALDGLQGIKYIGENELDRSGFNVSGAQDFNGDGSADFVTTAFPFGTDDGKCYVIFGPSALNVSKMKASLNFAKPARDSISLKGSISLPDGFKPAGQQVFVNVGGTTRALVLDGKGTGKAGNDVLKIKLKSKNGIVPAQLAPLTISLKNGDFAGSLADEGLINASLSDVPVNVGVFVQFSTGSSHGFVPLSYSAKQGKSGKAK